MGHEGVNATSTESRLRLAHRFLREIRSPAWGIAGQGVRYVLSGSFMAVVYVTLTTLLFDVLSLRFQVALATSFVFCFLLNFTLQRVFVWRHYQRFALAPHRQAVRYMAVSAGQYGVTALATSQLPGPLGLPVEAVYLATAIAVAGVNFMVFRGRVFHPAREDRLAESTAA